MGVTKRSQDLIKRDGGASRHVNIHDKEQADVHARMVKQQKSWPSSEFQSSPPSRMDIKLLGEQRTVKASDFETDERVANRPLTRSGPDRGG